MNTIKVKNVTQTTIGVPDGKGGTITIAPGEEKEIPTKYLDYLKGSVAPVKGKQGGSKK